MIRALAQAQRGSKFGSTEVSAPDALLFYRHVSRAHSVQAYLVGPSALSHVTEVQNTEPDSKSQHGCAGIDRHKVGGDFIGASDVIVQVLKLQAAVVNDCRITNKGICRGRDGLSWKMGTCTEYLTQ